jgi:hypothetical protein
LTGTAESSHLGRNAMSDRGITYVGTKVAGGSYLIDPAGHKKAQKTEKIHKKASGGAGSEKEWLKKTGPQLPKV